FRGRRLQGPEADPARLGLAAAPADPAVGRPHGGVDIAAAGVPAPGQHARHARVRPTGNKMQAAMNRLLAALLLLAASAPAHAYMAYVTNERDNTMSVVDLDQMKTVKTVPVGQRPRGVTI